MSAFATFRKSVTAAIAGALWTGAALASPPILLFDLAPAGDRLETGFPQWCLFRGDAAIPRRLFAAILERIQRLRRPEVGVVPSG